MEIKAENVKNIRSLALCKEFLRQAVEQVDQLNEELRHQKYKLEWYRKWRKEHPEKINDEIYP